MRTWGWTLLGRTTTPCLFVVTVALATSAPADTGTMSGQAGSTCPPAQPVECDVVILLASNTAAQPPDPVLWRRTLAEAADWAASGVARVAVAQWTSERSSANATEDSTAALRLLTAPDAGGFVSSDAELRRLQLDDFYADAALVGGPTAGNATAEALAGIRGAAAALSADSATLHRRPGVPQRLLVLVSAVRASNCRIAM